MEVGIFNGEATTVGCPIGRSCPWYTPIVPEGFRPMLVGGEVCDGGVRGKLVGFVVSGSTCCVIVENDVVLLEAGLAGSSVARPV